MRFSTRRFSTAVELSNQLNRDQKPSGWKAHVWFSWQAYRVRLYSTTRWRKISIKQFFLSFDQGRIDIFQIECFNFLPIRKLTSFVSLERGDSTLSYKERSQKNSIQRSVNCYTLFSKYGPILRFMDRYKLSLHDV